MFQIFCRHLLSSKVLFTFLATVAQVKDVVKSYWSLNLLSVALFSISTLTLLRFNSFWASGMKFLHSRYLPSKLKKNCSVLCLRLNFSTSTQSTCCPEQRLQNSSFCFLVTVKSRKIFALKLKKNLLCHFKVQFLQHYLINVTNLYYVVAMATRLLKDTISNLGVVTLYWPSKF